MTEKNGEDRQAKQVASSDHDVAIAGFSILESLFISLKETGVLDQREIYGLLTDAAEAHHQRARFASNNELHLRVAKLIEAFRNGGKTTKPGQWLR